MAPTMITQFFMQKVVTQDKNATHHLNVGFT